MGAITVVFNPSGGTCTHVHLKDEKGNLVEVTTEAELLTDHKEEDSILVKQIKTTIREQKSPTKESIKDALEEKEFQVK